MDAFVTKTPRDRSWYSFVSVRFAATCCLLAVLVSACTAPRGTGILSSREVSCGTVIDTLADLSALTSEEQWSAITDSAAFPAAEGGHPTLTLVRHGEDSDDLPPFFAKTGLVVRSGVAVEIEVIGGAEGTAIGWGGSHDPAKQIQVPACGSEAPWVVFAGGYYTYEPTCILLRVSAPTESAEVGIPVGMECPAP